MRPFKHQTMFQHTAARRRLGHLYPHHRPCRCFNTQPPEGGWFTDAPPVRADAIVSTHSRPKAAGSLLIINRNFDRFQHTAARRRLGRNLFVSRLAQTVSTHSRPKAAGRYYLAAGRCECSFNTQPPEGGWICHNRRGIGRAGFNTQPPEGGWTKRNAVYLSCVSFNTQPPEGGWVWALIGIFAFMAWFQHTAARRRLAPNHQNHPNYPDLFQHTAARRRLGRLALKAYSTE